MWDKLQAQLVRRGLSLLRLPIKLTPFAVRRQVLEQVLPWQFPSALAEGELDFFEGSWLQIEVVDLCFNWAMTLRDGQFQVSQHATPDVIFSSQSNGLLLIAAGREDPDALFFQRRLRIEGDTELGLRVKNLLDATDPEHMPALLRRALQQLADLVEAGLKEDAIAADGYRITYSC
ncbi:MAG: ubiquinone anaerobic biosynthesis accessory factor UbiT [Sodalis sp. (in: enterobacteria)]|uniref:ubiquinone anaerobic biosynthesis accessory factor UbiT n=1 Tax=Sodalis sp. (in: enterobacteria) TaxID=1898979 RepID=UPI003F2F6D91